MLAHKATGLVVVDTACLPRRLIAGLQYEGAPQQASKLTERSLTNSVDDLKVCQGRILLVERTQRPNRQLQP